MVFHSQCDNSDYRCNKFGPAAREPGKREYQCSILGVVSKSALMSSVYHTSCKAVMKSCIPEARSDLVCSQALLMADQVRMMQLQRVHRVPVCHAAGDRSP